MFTEAEGTALELSWKLHKITILTRLAKAKLEEGVFPFPFLKHQFVHIFYLSCPEKKKLLYNTTEWITIAQKWRSSYGNLSWQLSCSVSSSFCHICVGRISQPIKDYRGFLVLTRLNSLPSTSAILSVTQPNCPQLPKTASCCLNIKKLKSSHGLPFYSGWLKQDSLMDTEIKSWSTLSLLHTSQTFYPCNSATLTSPTQKIPI